MTKLWQFMQGHPKPAFSKKTAKWGQEKLFKNRPKNSPRLESPNALAQMPLTYNLYALKVRKLEKILAQKAAPKRP